ncbi:hypothetical protein AB0G71_17670 [Streptomyces sp. NPDC020403]|uniref:hypothetical protein n=1 Tax=unclassified Streptomyces TaxID=2593676 RepID=UPI00340C25BB
MRDAFAALLLAVLTVVGGVPAAADAVPPPGAVTGHPPTSVHPATTALPAPAGAPAREVAALPARSALAPPGLRVSAPPDRAVVASPARRWTAPSAPRAVAPQGSGPSTAPDLPSGPPWSAVSAPEASRDPGPVAGAPAAGLDGAGWWAQAVPAPGPRAGADRPHAPHHFPPPGHGALPPRAPGLLVPCTVQQGPAGAAVLVPGRTGAALPGVRGPPGSAAGQPVLHRSCSTDPPSRVL